MEFKFEKEDFYREQFMAWLKNKGMSYAKAARRLDMSNATLINFVNKKPIKRETLRRIALFMGNEVSG